MTARYSFRIMAHLPDQAPVELFRSAQKYSQYYWSFVTRDLSPEWCPYLEETTKDKETIAGRPRLPSHYDRAHPGFHLDPENVRRIKSL